MNKKTYYTTTRRKSHYFNIKQKLQMVANLLASVKQLYRYKHSLISILVSLKFALNADKTQCSYRFSIEKFPDLSSRGMTICLTS